MVLLWTVRHCLSESKSYQKLKNFSSIPDKDKMDNDSIKTHCQWLQKKKLTYLQLSLAIFLPTIGNSTGKLYGITNRFTVWRLLLAFR